MANIINQKKHEEHEIINVAVILPVYNTALYLEECLDSLLNQTYKHFTIFAVNDGSSDNSGEILDAYAKKDSRIHVINKTNGGVSSARNVALNKISEDNSFDLVCFTDSDDFVTPSFLDTYVEYARRYKADYIVCGWAPFDKKGAIDRKQLTTNTPPKEVDRYGAFQHAYSIGDWKKLHLASTSYFLANRCFAWKTIQNNRFDETMSVGEDQDFLVRAILNINKGLIVNEINYMYRQRSSSLSHTINDASTDIVILLSLISKTKNFPDSINIGLLQRATELWWQSVRYAILTNTFLQHNLRLTKAYKRLRMLSNSVPLPPRVKKRFKIFSLGECFLKIYFFFTNQRIIKNNSESNFD